MALFGRRRQESSSKAVPREQSRFESEAAAAGWQAADETAVPTSARDQIQECVRVLYGETARPTATTDLQPHRTNYHDVFRTSIDGRAMTIANGSMMVQAPVLEHSKRVSICVAELPSVLAIAYIEPHRVPALSRVLPEAPTGNPTFDERFKVAAVEGFGPAVVTPEMQHIVMAHIDWIFRTDGGLLICVREGAWESVTEMREFVDEVLAFIAAIPESVLPSHVDHSTDDLVARIDKLESVEDAIAFLQQLTPAEREKLAKSDTPLAAFADVTTPEEAFARFESLDQSQKLQLVTMFDRVTGND